MSINFIKREFFLISLFMLSLSSANYAMEAPVSDSSLESDLSLELWRIKIAELAALYKFSARHIFLCLDTYLQKMRGNSAEDTREARALLEMLIATNNILSQYYASSFSQESLSPMPTSQAEPTLRWVPLGDEVDEARVDNFLINLVHHKEKARILVDYFFIFHNHKISLIEFCDRHLQFKELIHLFIGIYRNNFLISSKAADSGPSTKKRRFMEREQGRSDNSCRDLKKNKSLEPAAESQIPALYENTTRKSDLEEEEAPQQSAQLVRKKNEKKRHLRQTAAERKLENSFHRFKKPRKGPLNIREMLENEEGEVEEDSVIVSPIQNLNSHRPLAIRALAATNPQDHLVEGLRALSLNGSDKENVADSDYANN